MEAARRLVGCLALAGVICLTAEPGNAAQITIQQFTFPTNSSLVITYTSDTIGDFKLPGTDGAYTRTYVISDTASYPLWETITGTVPVGPGWLPTAVVVTTTMPDGDQSWYELVMTDTSPPNNYYNAQNFRYTATVVHLEVNDNNEDFLVSFTNTEIPEPATAVLLGASALGLLICRMRRRRAAR